MPFTPAHTAILFPARYVNPSYISWTALIIGSMVPDTEYFLWMNSASFISHTLTGILIFNLPMVFLIGFAWHSFIAKELLPRIPFLKQKYKQPGIKDFQNMLKKKMPVFIISALVGIMSHLVWDSFCHAKGFMVNKIPALLEHITIANHEIRWCYVLWYACTMIGMLIITITAIDFKSIFRLNEWKIISTNKSFYLKVLLYAVIIGVVRISFGLNQNVPRHLIIIAISSILFATVIQSYLQNNKISKV